MKVVTPKEMSRIEKLSCEKGGDEDLYMQNAGHGVAKYIDDYMLEHALGERIVLLCGKGNNGGDAYVAGIHLISYGYQVYAYSPAKHDECSPLCKKYADQFKTEGGRLLTEARQIDIGQLLVDALFGTGFQGEVKEPYVSLIQYANESKKNIIAIDIPSGLNGESGIVEGAAIIAQATVFLGFPKTGFFLNDGWNYTGKIQGVDFGLAPEYKKRAVSSFCMLSYDDLHLPPIQRNRHKYQAGHVVGLGGSPGMAGAALMASSAGLRSGAGMVHLLHPQHMEQELSPLPFELIKIPYHSDQPETALQNLNRADAIFIGPGMGRDQKMGNFLKTILSQIKKPVVLDADALYLLSQQEMKLPEHTILTPHSGEMARLLHETPPLTLNRYLLQKCQEYAEEKRTTLVLKGGPTFIFHPETAPAVCPRGTPGMATAGSGDVLTGIIAALLAQGLSLPEAAYTGVYLHASAGEAAENFWTSYCMNATDIMDFLPHAVRELTQN